MRPHDCVAEDRTAKLIGKSIPGSKILPLACKRDYCY